MPYEQNLRGRTVSLAIIVPDEEQLALTKALALLDAANIDPAIRVRILGLNLMNVVGLNVLTAAVDPLRKEMTEEEKLGVGGQNTR